MPYLLKYKQKEYIMFTRLQRKMVMELVVHGDNCHKCVHYQTDKCKGKVDDDYCLKGILASYCTTNEKKRETLTAEQKCEKQREYARKYYNEKLKNNPEYKARARENHRRRYEKIKASTEFKEKNSANNKRWHEEHPNARRERYERVLERKAEELRLKQEQNTPQETVRLSGKSKHVPTVEECENCPHSDKCNGGERCVL